MNELQVEGLVGPVAMDLIGHTGFDRTQHTDQALGDMVSLGYLQSHFLFVGSGRGQVFIGSSGRLDSCRRGLDQLGRLVQGVLFEVFHENPEVPQIGIHPRQIGDQTKGSAKNDAVPTAENPYNALLMFFNECVHGILLEIGCPIRHTTTKNIRDGCLFHAIDFF